MNKAIGVLGCGWLGLPLAERLLDAGYAVRGTTTRTEKLPVLRQAGIRAQVLELGESGFSGDPADFLDGLDCLVFNIPPGVRSNPRADFPARVRHLLHALEQAGDPRLIFVSSTSVYGRAQGVVDESDAPDPDTESGRQLVAAENLVRDTPSGKTALILRFGGLIGPDRHPVTLLSGRSGLTGGRDPVNLIDQEDCIGLIMKIVADPGLTGTINAVAPGHPPKADYYRREAALRHLPPPRYLDGKGAPEGKTIKSMSFLINNHHFQTTPQA